MDKRYQVFVSSTFIDLKEERDKVIQTLMKMNCIPAGMEMFNAVDDEQFNFIKRVIDDSDYYIVIIGGRYGSLTADGLSFTEKEYDYAKEKGLKVIGLIHSEPDSIPVGKSEADPELRRKLGLFKEKVQMGRLVDYWKNAEELPSKVALSLQSTIRLYPAVGWVRGDEVSTDLYKELSELQKENSRLRNLTRDSVFPDVLIGEYSFKDIRKVLIRKLISINGDTENALTIFKRYRATFSEGINPYTKEEELILLLKELCPTLIILGLIQSWAGTNNKLTPEGHKFLQWEFLYEG